MPVAKTAAKLDPNHPCVEILRQVTLNPTEQGGFESLQVMLAAEESGFSEHFETLVRDRLEQGLSREWWQQWLRTLRRAGFVEISDLARQILQDRRSKKEANLAQARATVQVDPPDLAARRLIAQLVESPNNKSLKSLLVELLDRMMAVDTLAILEVLKILITEFRDPPPAIFLRYIVYIGSAPECDILLRQMDEKWGENSPSAKIRKLMVRFGSGILGRTETFSNNPVRKAIRSASVGDINAAEEHFTERPKATDPSRRASWVDRVNQMDALPQGARALVDESSTGDVIESDPHTGEVLVLVLGGLLGRFTTKLLALDHLLAERGAGAIYLFDQNVAAYYKGVKSLGPDMATTLNWVKDRIAARGPKRVVVLAMSSGGWAGAVMALSLNATRALYFGPVLSLDIDFRTSIGDLRANHLRRRSIPEVGEDASCLHWYNRLPARPLTRLICSADRKIDIAHANLLKNVENVEISIVPEGYGHVQIMTMLGTGELATQLDWLLSEPLS